MVRTIGAATRLPLKNSMRARAWSAMRNHEQRRQPFTVTQLRLVAQEEPGLLDKRYGNLTQYVSRLAKAGYLRCVRLPPKGQERVWRLARDTGPLPPVLRKAGGGVFDPNTQELFEADHDPFALFAPEGEEA